MTLPGRDPSAKLIYGIAIPGTYRRRQATRLHFHAREASRPGFKELICSFECTFCQDCATTQLSGTCPNCEGGLLPRPTRAEALLSKFPATTTRTYNPAGSS